MTTLRSDAVTGYYAPRPFWREALLLSFLLAVGLLPSTARGQAGPANISNGPRSASDATPSESTSAQQERQAQPIFGLLRPEDGSVLQLPPGTKYEDYLNWLSTRRGSGYGINSVQLTGTASNEATIKLKAIIKVVIHRDGEWVRIPLNFKEALLEGVMHDGDGLVSYEPFLKENGHAWSFQGRGEHELQLNLVVPVAVRSDETRLSLSTPANAATTSLRLNLPEGAEATTTEGLLRNSGDQAKEGAVEWIGAGGKIDLAWRPKPVLSDPTDLSVVTEIVPTVSGKMLQLRARQSISPSQGSVSSVQVRLPEGFSLSEVEGALLRSKSERLSENGRIVSVDLKEPTGSTFDLTWRVSAPLPATGEITINGFSVEGVPPEAQSGQIYIEERSSAHAITLVESATEGVSRIEMVEPGPMAVTAAYSYSGQPYRVGLKVEPVIPTFVVTPDMTFTVFSDRIDLTADFGVDVRKGELREMKLLWPAVGWSLPSIRAGRVQEVGRDADGSPPIDLLVTNGSVPFEIPVRASRPRSDASERVSIPLPKIEANGQQAADSSQEDILICVRHPTNLRVEVMDAGGTPLEPFDPADRSFSPPESGDNERVDILTAPAGTREVTFRVQRLSQEIRSSTVLSIRPRGENLLVEQRIDYDIRHDPLSKLNLLVPESLLSQGLEFVDSSNTKLAQNVARTREGDLVEVRVDLGASVIGPISVATTFEVRRAAVSDRPVDAVLPKIMPADGAFDAAHVRVWPLPRHHLRLIGDGWSRNQSTFNDGQENWIGGEDTSARIPIQLVPKANDEISRVTVDRLLLRSVIDREGRIRTFADGRIESAPSTIEIRFPPNAIPEGFRWRGRDVSANLIAEDDEGVVLEIPLPAGNAEPILAFAFTFEADDALGFFERYEIPEIRFAEEVVVLETLWRLTLPESQHLFNATGRYFPQFRWSFRGGMWVRASDEAYGNAAAWLGAKPSPLGTEFDRGHSYVFSRPGAPRTLKFTAIARSLVVLIGAGMAIMFGYAFANGLVPQPRVAVMALAGVVLLSWAFFADQVQLFLQPALFGLVLVAGAVLAERLLQKRQNMISPLAPPSAVDLVTILPGEGSASAPSAAIGSEEPTVLRSGRPVEALSSHGGDRHVP